MSKKFNLKTWDGFSELPERDVDLLLDTTALNKKLADKRNSPYRMRVGSFHVPKGISTDQFQRSVKTACDKFITAMGKQGFVLASKLQVFGRDAKGTPFPAHDLPTNAILLDMDEYRVRAIFKTEPKPVRLELPPSSVRQDPEQKSSLAQIARGEGISPVSRHLRPQK